MAIWGGGYKGKHFISLSVIIYDIGITYMQAS